jgi:hypothetical protein
MGISVLQRLRQQGYEKLHLSMRDGTITDLANTPSIFTPTGTATPIKSENGMSLFGNGASYLTGAANAGYNIGTGDFTLSAWCRFSRIGGVYHVAAIGWTGFDDGARIVLVGGNIWAGSMTNAGAGIQALNAFANSNWNHVIVVRATQVLYGYLNGIAMTTTGVAGANANLANHTRSRIFADAAALAGNIGNGFVDEVFFHSAAMNAQDASIFMSETKPRD